MSDRSSRAEVRNPVLTLPAMRALRESAPETRRLIAALLTDIHDDGRRRADLCWFKHKAPMAAYWKAVSVYAGHIARAIRKGTP